MTITARITLKLSNSVDKHTSDRGVKTITQATAQPAVRAARSTQNVSTDAALTMPGVAAGNYGIAVFENMDADSAKYIEIGPEHSSAIKPCLRVYGGQQAMLQLVPSVVYRAQASAGTQILAIDLLAK